MAGIKAAMIPTKIVSKNKIPSLSQINSYGLKLILKSSSAELESNIKAILPRIVPKRNPTTHNNKLSIITNNKSLNRPAPLTLNKANSNFLSFNVLNKAIKIEIPEINMIPYAK